MRQRHFGVVAALFLAAAPPAAHAQNWTGAGDGVTWLDGSNWDSGAAPMNPGESATFDAAFASLSQPVQITGNLAISALNVVNAPGDVVIADDEPLHPFLTFTLDGGGGTVPIKLDAAPGYSLTFDESLASLMFNDDVEVDHMGSSTDVFRIASRVFGGQSLTLHPGSGRSELVGSFFQLNNLRIEHEAQLGDDNADGVADFFTMNGDMRIGAAAKVASRALTQSLGALGVDGALVVEPRGFANSGGLVGAGTIEVQSLGEVYIAGGANLFTGSINLAGGSLRVGSPFGGPAGSVRLGQYATIGTTSPLYNPATDPAVVVHPSVVTPGTVGLAIDNVLMYGLPIDLNFNNGVPNAYRLGSPSLSTFAFGTPIVPFDDGVNAPVYFLGGPGHLFIDTTLTDSPISGNATNLIMPTFPTLEPGVNLGAIFLNQFTSFTGRVRVEQEQLILTHPLAVQSAASLDISGQGPQYDGGNYVHGTIVLTPALLGAYAGPAPALMGGALGFTSAHILTGLPTGGGLLGPATFDATNFGGGSPTSSLLALGGGAVGITQGPGFPIHDLLSPSGDPVVLITTDQAVVELTQPNFHTGGTAVVGQSRLVISNASQLGPGPLNIADGATLHVTASMTIFNALDLHDAVAFGRSQIAVDSLQALELRGSMSTAAAPQATLAKLGAGKLLFDPVVPWSPTGGENAWGLRLVEGDVILNQLPEDDSPQPWQVGPLALDSSGILVVAGATAANATNYNRAGFRVVRVAGGSNTQISVDAGAELKLAGVDDRNEVYGVIEKVGPGTLWLGGDSTGGDAVGSHYTGRGDLNIVNGTLLVGGLPGTDDKARAFPDDAILRIQRNAALKKVQDQPGRVQSLYIDDTIPGLGIAFMTLSPSGLGLGDGSLNADIGPLGTFDLDGVLEKDGPAALRLSARPGATISIFGGFVVDEGALEVDASGIDPLTDTITGTSAGVTTNGVGAFHVTAGTARVTSLGGTGRTRVDAGARLVNASAVASQRVFEINGELVSPLVSASELITGRGQITGTVGLAAAGRLAPNDDVLPTPTPATLTVTGNLGLGAELNIDVDGATATADAVNVLGSATLNGRLSVDVHSSYATLGNFSHAVLTAGGGVHFSFGAVPSPGDYLGYGVVYSGTAVSPGDVTITLTQTSYADFDDDLDVDDADYNIWKAGFGAGTTHAQGDADLDGDVDGFDFLVWQSQFGTAFTLPPPSGTPIGVPEPGTSLLVALTVFVLARKRRLR